MSSRHNIGKYDSNFEKKKKTTKVVFSLKGFIKKKIEEAIKAQNRPNKYWKAKSMPFEKTFQPSKEGTKCIFANTF